MAAAVWPVPLQRVLDADGAPAVAWTMTTYEAGTDTPSSLFADSDLSVPLANPMVSDSEGYWPQAYPPTDVVLKYVLADDSAVIQWTADNVPAVEPASVPTPAGEAPTIDTQPTDQTKSAGQTATVVVVASGTATLTYQWYRGSSGDTSTPIVGAVGASYQTLPLAVGVYTGWVRVSNAFGTADSVTITITVT